jgi:hypothetical protein
MKIYSYEGKKNICGERVRRGGSGCACPRAIWPPSSRWRGSCWSGDSVSRIEIGARFVADYELMTLARILGVSTDWLLGGPDLL